MPKILVIDDSATVRQQVSLTLGEEGFDIVEAVDGVDGAEKIAALDDINLVICDVNMPRMNGLDMLEKVRTSGDLGNTPVVMLTTEGSADLIKRGKALGAKGWVIKPFKANLLIAAAKNSRRSADRVAPTAPVHS
ncbi:MAG: response regulator [Nannocystaceae bacterium]